MAFSYFIIFVLSICGGIVVGEDIKSQIYRNMCDDNRNFREGMIKCLQELPRKDQLIFQICGSVMANDTTEDYNSIVDDMCENVSFATKAAVCVDHLYHMLLHFSDSASDHHHHDNHHHHHHHHHHDDDDDKSHDDDDESKDYDDDRSKDYDDESQEDEEEEYQKHFHHKGQSSKHGLYTQSCFKKLYASYNITASPAEE